MSVRVTHAKTSQRFGLVQLQQRAELRKRYVAQIPKWRHPLIGYLMSVPIVGLALLGVLLVQYFLKVFSFPGVSMFLAVVLIALIWGVGPALFSVVLSTLALDYFYLSPVDHLDITNGPGLLQLLPFIVSGIFIAIITAQRESARLRALFAEQEAQERASELERTNVQLEQANQLKDQFISMASHELKTPITSIRGQAQVTLRRLSKQRELPKEFVEARTSLEKIDEQTKRLNTLVDDLLNLGSIRSGKIALRLNAHDIGEICRSVVEEQRLLSGRAIDLLLPEKSVIIDVDSDRLSQVVTNLVTNALKYSPEDRPVQVRVLPEDKAVCIEVHDAGQGIPQDQQKHIFETFYRAPDAHSSKQTGWGLGLAICKDIVERHGGCIWCESQLGVGSTFFVELPL